MAMTMLKTMIPERGREGEKERGREGERENQYHTTLHHKKHYHTRPPPLLTDWF
jgi:hypothetical protein